MFNCACGLHYTSEQEEGTVAAAQKMYKACEVPAKADSGGGKAKGLVTFAMIILFW